MVYVFLLQIVITLEIYGVKKIVGIPFGYRGFRDEDISEMPVCSKNVPINLRLNIELKS